MLIWRGGVSSRGGGQTPGAPSNSTTELHKIMLYAVAKG